MSEHGIPALDELRESLREAAARDIAARPRRRRSRKRLGGLAAVLVVLAGGAVATATDLISEGTPVKPQSRFAVPSRYQPTQTGGRLAVQAHDTPAPWGVEVYTSQTGKTCAILGRVRGYTLGELRNGTFHAYAPGRSGQCASPLKGVVQTGSKTVSDGRTVYWGLARPGIETLHVSVGGKAYPPVRTGLDGAFLIVFKGPLDGRLSVTGS
jgi:hypothetical protein